MYLAKDRPLQFYDAHDFEGLRARVLADFKGKTVVIVGHSNTLLPIIKAFGARSPLQQIGEDQYDTVFKLQISRRGKATVQVLRFGALSSWSFTIYHWPLTIDHLPLTIDHLSFTHLHIYTLTIMAMDHGPWTMDQKLWTKKQSKRKEGR